MPLSSSPPASRRWVALLRGINVGKAKRVAMADLSALVESLGYRDVETLLNSGNVVFTATAKGEHGAKIERALAAKLGVTARVTVLSADDLAVVLRENSLGKVATDPSKTLVAVLADPKSRKLLDPLAAKPWGDEAIAVGSRAAYLWCPGGVIDSKVAAAMAKAMGDGVTSRNWATMTKLAALAASEPPA